MLIKLIVIFSCILSSPFSSPLFSHTTQPFLHLLFYLPSLSLFPSYCFLPRCVRRESWWRWWRRPLHRSPRHRWWNPAGERRGSGWTQSGPRDAAHDPRKHRVSSDHAGKTHPALTGKIGMAQSHCSCSHCLHCWWTVTWEIVSAVLHIK